MDKGECDNANKYIAVLMMAVSLSLFTREKKLSELYNAQDVSSYIIQFPVWSPKNECSLRVKVLQSFSFFSCFWLVDFSYNVFSLPNVPAYVLFRFSVESLSHKLWIILPLHLLSDFSIVIHYEQTKYGNTLLTQFQNFDSIQYMKPKND